MDSLFSYNNYLDYLQDFYKDKKNKFSFFSFRYMETKLKIDASFLNKVIQKKIHLTEKTIPKFINFLKLTDDEAEYFILLINYAKATSKKEAYAYTQKIKAFQANFQKVSLSVKQMYFFQHWYVSLVYEYILHFSDRFTIQSIIKNSIPKITYEQIVEALDILKSIGLIIEKKDSSYQALEKIVTNTSKRKISIVENWKKEFIHLFLETSDQISQREQLITGTVLSLSEENFKKLIKNIYELRHEAMALSIENSEKKRVYQLNIQLFPLTNTLE